MTQAASALYEKAWGKPWPSMSKGTIMESDIQKTDSADNDNDSYLADKLRFDSPFDYVYFGELDGVKRALGDESSAQEETLVVRAEYIALHLALESKYKNARALVVTGQPGIGSYESWFSSQSNADFYPILRQDHLPPLPSFTSSRERTSNSNPTGCSILLHI